MSRGQILRRPHPLSMSSTRNHSCVPSKSVRARNPYVYTGSSQTRHSRLLLGCPYAPVPPWPLNCASPLSCLPRQIAQPQTFDALDPMRHPFTPLSTRQGSLARSSLPGVKQYLTDHWTWGILLTTVGPSVYPLFVSASQIPMRAVPLTIPHLISLSAARHCPVSTLLEQNHLTSSSAVSTPTTRLTPPFSPTHVNKPLPFPKLSILPSPRFSPH